MMTPEAPGLPELRDSPAWYPLEPLGEGVRVLRLEEAAYRAASFLDQRLLLARPRQLAVARSVLAAAAGEIRASSFFLFHIGHVGSTLLARLIGEHPAFFALREPALLRALAETHTPHHGSAAPTPALPLDVALPLLARTWRADQRAVVKATSYVSEIADDILAASREPAAVFVFAEPLAYLRGIFGGPNSRVEARSLAAARRRRLVRRLDPAPWHSDPRSEGELIALSWLTEMLTLYQSTRRRSGRILWVNFDAFLGEPRGALMEIFRTLGAEATPGELRTLLDGPIMRQYAKGPEFAYDAALRHDVLALADREHGVEIRQGMQWLSAVAAEHAPVRALLEFLSSLRA